MSNGKLLRLSSNVFETSMGIGVVMLHTDKHKTQPFKMHYFQVCVLNTDCTFTPINKLMARKRTKTRNSHNQIANCFVFLICFICWPTQRQHNLYEENIYFNSETWNSCLRVRLLVFFGDQFIPIGSGIVRFQEVKLCCSAL